MNKQDPTGLGQPDISPLFDPAWYLRRNPDVAASGLSPEDHFLNYGMAEGRSPHPFFDSDWYLQVNTDVARSGLSATRHFFVTGLQEGRAPHPFFDGNWYNRTNLDVANSEHSAIVHFLKYGMAEGRSPHPFFDAQFYTRTNADDHDVQDSPFAHFIQYGLSRGLRPHPLIDPDWYLQINDDVASGDLNPIQHFILYGIKEGRCPHPIFDGEWYLQNNPQAKQSSYTSFEHFLAFGLPAGFDPHPLFDTSWYVKNYPDIKSYSISPLLFFAEFGMRRGDIPTPFFDEQFYCASRTSVTLDPKPPFERYLYDDYQAGITCTRLFDEEFYVGKYREKLAGRQPPFIHFLRYGQYQSLDPHPLFDTKWYTNKLNGAAVEKTIFTHYITADSTSSPHPGIDADFIGLQLSKHQSKQNSERPSANNYIRNRDFNPSTTVFTSIALNYLPQAVVLGESLKKHASHIYFVIVLCDDNTNQNFAEYNCIDEVIHLKDLVIEHPERWIFKHELVELCTAIKGPALRHLLRREKANNVIYLDPDIMIFNALTIVEEALVDSPVLLTPHLLTPEIEPSAIEQNEFDALKHGAFNLGFLAVRHSPEGLAFADWWSDRLERYCFDKKSVGLFVDQKWVDLAPGLFDGVRVLRHPGCNVAPWNLSQRKVTGDINTGFTVNDLPLIFFHFSGFMSGAGLTMFARYTSEADAARQLYEIYVRETAIKTALLGPTSPWEYETYNNGKKIEKRHRTLYRERTDLQLKYPEPRSAKPGETYFEWLSRRNLIDRSGRSTDVDADWYLTHYQDVAASGMSPQIHYENHGKAEGRFANRRMATRAASTSWAGGKTILEQYLALHNLYEIRPNTLFDPNYYLKRYKDIEISGIDPLVHFLGLGLREGRQGCREFDPLFYASQTHTSSYEEAFWNVLRDGCPANIRPTPSYLEEWDEAVFAAVKDHFTPGHQRILMISHIWGGGTTKAFKDLCSYIQPKADVMVLAPTRAGQLSLEFWNKTQSPLLFDVEDVKDTLIKILRGLNFNRVHIHHVLGLNESVSVIIRKLGLFYDITLHDTYFLTPNPLFVHSADARSADGLEAAMERAAADPLDKTVPADITIAAWRSKYKTLLMDANRIIAPSKFIADVYRTVYPDLTIEIVPHLEPQASKIANLKQKVDQTSILCVAVIADLGEHKGSRILQQCALLSGSRQLPLRFMLIGQSTPGFQCVNLTSTGSYDDRDLYDILRRHNVGSIWLPYQAPESYSFVLSSALASGLPVSVTDVGCLPERTRDYPQAFVFPVETNADEWLAHFLSIRSMMINGNISYKNYERSPTFFYAERYL